MMTVIPGLATAASRATAAADRDPHSASRGPVVVKANAFLTVDGDHVRVAEDGGIVYDRDAEGSFTVSARSGWLVEGRETLTVPYSAERPRALKVTGLTGEDGTEVPVEPDDEEEPEEEEDYTLSIECDRYLGLDRTDSGRLGHTVKTATATLDPECEGATVTWISCGSLCEFVEGDRVVTNPTGWTVSYRNKDPDTPSTEVDAEELVAEVTIPGKDGTISASKRFTVVKVEVEVGDVGEDKEESEGAFIPYVADKDGLISVEGTNKLVAVSITCEPELPRNETVRVSHSGSGELYEKKTNNELLKVTSTSYPACEIGKRKFVLHGHQGSPNLTNGVITVEHDNSEAKDATKYTVVKLCVTNIKFNHDHSSSAADAINIRRSYAEDIDVSGGEWIDTGGKVKNEPFCYTTNRTVTVMARFEASDFITSAMISATCEGTKGSLSDALETNVVFSGGVSSPEYVTFTLKDKTLSQIDCARDGILKWQANRINGGGSPCEMNQSGPHTVYTIFCEPKSPWNNTYGSQQNAWTNALEFLIQDCAANSLSTSLSVLENATLALYQIPYTSRSQCWAGGGAAFSFSQYMSRSFANCLDSSYGMCVTMRLAGVELISVKRTNFFQYNFHCYTKFPVGGDFLVFDCCSAVRPLQNGVLYSEYLRAGNPYKSVETELNFSIK